ncbi:MAG TPA: alpha-glucuronidase family glycosyl hydrolase [Terriglobia bacterium]|nr:alpha-glucuronidase family glycosyl hydrolase [Terriglobia bacterium]
MQRVLTLILLLLLPTLALAESGYEAWLRYAPLEESSARRYRDFPAVVVSLGTEAPVQSAREELVRGVRGMLKRQLRVESRVPSEPAIVIGTLTQVRQALPDSIPAGSVEVDGFWLKTVRNNGNRFIVITGQNDRGVLYGSFSLLRKIAFGEPVAELDHKENPYSPIRWINHWENLDGSIERGYGGRSIFWENGRARQDLSRVSDYGRLLASLGISGCSINNVNADPRVISTEFLPEIARVADALRPWGVKVVLAVDFGSPRTVGGLTTFDPLDPAVIAFWKNKVDEIYRAVPDLGGLVLKADSEGRIGPSAVGRTHADAANLIARALKPHGGYFFYRGFVYDNRMDWRNLKNDRARAANDNFKNLDGKFDDNALIQIKNGPIDFQVREPASPLFGNLEKTNQVIELQITQEYMGQARHTVFLVPMWKEVLDFDMRARPGTATPVKALVSGKTFGRPLGGFIGVSNVGLDDNWYGNHMSQANLYGFGRLAWNPDLTSSQIVDEWTRLTFGNDQKVMETIANIQLSSWRTYENYTGPLGLQTLTDIVGNHYGVAVEASERNGWGQWHRADEKGVGMDRSVATGTGFAGQFRPEVARIYETIENTPDDLLLFMHHVPYTQKLKSGKTVIQFIYDSHYDGADAVEKYVSDWKSLKGRIDDRRYGEVLQQLSYQAGQAVVWRDAVAGWFYKMSKIPDARGRVGNYPGRLEAESAVLSGYRVLGVTPFEAASGEKAVECTAGSTCSANFKFDGQSGWYDITVRYFDVNNGVARYRVRVGGRLVAEWTGTDRVPSRRVDSGSSARRIIEGIALRPGDQIQIEGLPDSGETAALDYIEIRAAAN